VGRVVVLEGYRAASPFKPTLFKLCGRATSSCPPRVHREEWYCILSSLFAQWQHCLFLTCCPAPADEEALF